MLLIVLKKIKLLYQQLSLCLLLNVFIRHYFWLIPFICIHIWPFSSQVLLRAMPILSTLLFDPFGSTQYC
jgi:hypothetical protein